MAKFRWLIAQFPGQAQSHPATNEWVARTYHEMQRHPEIGEGNVDMWWKVDTPITMLRNQALIKAEKEGFDFLLMVDADMAPDLEGQKPFFRSSWEFMRSHNTPCVVAAPYCGPSPFEMVYVFRWENAETNDANPNYAIIPYTRQEAASLTGFKEAAALPTGVMAIDMRAIRAMKHPRFYYEWTDETCATKASTEDVAFSRDLHVMGVKMYCNWDSWAGHMKLKKVGKPEVIHPQDVPHQLRERAQELNASDYWSHHSAQPGVVQRLKKLVRK